eukprot:4459866-Prymnesium_polylepis.3
MKYVHVHCLNAWRAASVNPKSFYTCEQCGYSYRTQRTKIAEVLQRGDRFVWVGSWLLVNVLVGVASAAPGNAERYFYDLTTWSPREEFPWWEPWCDRLVAGMLLPGTLGFGHVIFKRLVDGGGGADAIFMALSATQMIMSDGMSPTLLLLCLVYC